MSVEIRIVSLGALASHPLRDEAGERRPGHATTSILLCGDRRILIDPSLPPDHLRQRLDERLGIGPDEISDVFLTDLRPERRRGIGLFPEAHWLVGEAERDAYRAAIDQRRYELDDEDDLDPDSERLLESESQVIARCGACRRIGGWTASLCSRSPGGLPDSAVGWSRCPVPRCSSAATPSPRSSISSRGRFFPTSRISSRPRKASGRRSRSRINWCSAETTW